MPGNKVTDVSRSTKGEADILALTNGQRHDDRFTCASSSWVASATR